MRGDLSLFLAIERLVQERMFSHEGMRVVKDVDIAEVLGVGVKELRLSVRRKSGRFPPDFMVVLDDGGYAFSEAGVIMLGGLLKSERAKKAHLQLIDYFVHLAQQNGLSVFDLLYIDTK